MAGRPARPAILPVSSSGDLMRVVITQAFRHIDEGQDQVLLEGEVVSGSAAAIALRHGWGKVIDAAPENKAVAKAPRNAGKGEG